jgi:branched-chain amino acid transport system substrate-binding protein
MKRLLILTFGMLALAACEKKPTPETATPAQPTQPSPGQPTTAPVAVAPTAPAAAPASDVFLIGEVGSITGSEATFGQSTHHGIELAIKELNGAGGVKGKHFELKTLDDEGKPDEAATATARLITKEHAQVILGEVASTNSKQMAPICQNNQVPMISPSSTNPEVTAIGDYIFRVCFIDPFQGTVMAKFAHDTLKATKVAILKDVASDYSMGLAKFFTQTFTDPKMGGTIVKESSYHKGDMDFKAQLTELKSAKPDAVYLPGYYTDVGLIVQQARELGITVPFMGGDGWDSEKLYELGGKALNGCYFSNHYSVQDPSPRIQKFIADYKAAYGGVPDALAALGYDAMRVAADAVARSKSFSGPDVRDAIAATRDFDGVTGKISLDALRNAVKPAVVLKVEDGKQVYQTTIAP